MSAGTGYFGFSVRPLRRLVDEARKREPDKRAARFMTAMAGNRRNYEEASRAPGGA